MKHTTYICGDLAEYTGKMKQIHGGSFYVFRYLEGEKKGKEGVTQRGPSGQDIYADLAKKEWKEQQEQFSRLHA
jgi:hypothetical protein